MKVLLLGDLAPTGFGSVTTDLGKEMLNLGIDLRFVSQNDTGGELPEPFRSRTVNLVSLPWAENPLTGEAGTVGGNTGIPGLIDGTSKALLHNGEPYAPWQPEAAIVLGDFGAARHIVGRFLDAFRLLNGKVFHYVPIEGTDLPPEWNRMWSFITPVAMTEFGADQIEKVTGTRPTMVYHGIDATVFHPVSKHTPLSLSKDGQYAILSTKQACKWALAEWLGAENRHTLPTNAAGAIVLPKRWMLRTDRHMPRKGYARMIRALGPVLERQPEWGMVIHCNILDQGGFLNDTLSKLSPLARAKIMLTNPDPEKGSSVPRRVLTVLYNAADLYISTSSEGFGLTIAEALACGVPAIGLDYSAVPEVIGPAGVTVPVAYLTDNEYDHYWGIIDEVELAERTEFLMTHHGKREELGRKGPAHVTTNFRWDTAARQFADLIHSAVPAGVAA